MEKALATAVACIALAACAANASITLTGETDNPRNNFFKQGNAPQITFRAKGMEPGGKSVLSVRILDAWNREIWRNRMDVAADAQGEWSGTVTNAPADRLGFYRVKATLADGTTLPKVGSRPRGCITYGICPPPESRPLYPEDETFWGIHGSFCGEERWMGLRWRNGNSLYSSAAEREKAAANTNRWQTYGHYNAHQVYSRGYTREEKERFPILTSWGWKKNGSVFGTDEAKAHYLKRLGERVRQARGFPVPGQGKRCWETLWEGNAGLGVKDQVEFHKVLYPFIHSLDPDSEVWGPCAVWMSSNKIGTLDDFAACGLFDYLDAVTIHPYCAYPPEEFEAPASAARAVELAEKYGNGRGVKVRSTEAGANWTAQHDGEQLAHIVRLNLILLGEGWASSEIFYGADMEKHCNGDYGLCYNLQLPEVPFGTQRMSPRPAALGISAASYLTEGYKSAGRIDWLGATSLGYAYQRGDEVRLALWDWAATNRVTIPVGKTKVAVADVMGNVEWRAASGGRLELDLTPDPVYVLGVDGALWGRNRKVSVTSLSRFILPGDKGRVTAKVRADEKFDGALELVPDPRLGKERIVRKVSFPCAGEHEFTLEFASSGGIAAGRYPVTVELKKAMPRRWTVFGRREKYETIAMDGTAVEVKSPVEAGRAEPAFAGGIPAVAVALRDVGGKGRSGELSVKIPGAGEWKKNFTLAPGEEREEKIALNGFSPDCFRLYDGELRIGSPGAADEVRAFRENFLGAAFLKPGEGDGRPDFDAITLHEIPGGTDGRRATAGFGWNKDFAFVRYVTQDDSVVQSKDAVKDGGGDMVKTVLARLRRDTDRSDIWNARQREALTETISALTPKGGRIARSVTFNQKEFPAGASWQPAKGMKLELRAKSLPDGKTQTVHDISIPWTQLNMQSPGMFHWGAAVIDADGGKTAEELRIFYSTERKANGAEGSRNRGIDPLALGSVALLPEDRE